MSALVEKNDTGSTATGEKRAGSRCCFVLDRSYYRFLALFLIIMTAFFYSASYDMPGPMMIVIERTFSVLPYEYEYMYSVYTLPNILLCLVSGMLIDRVFGLFRGCLLYGAISLLGQVMFTAGGFAMMYWLMLVGRFVNGVGSETISLCLSCFTVMWFRGKELNFVFGLFMSITRLGSSFDFLIYTPLYNHFRDIFSFRSAFGMSVVPFMIMSIIMVTSLLLLTMLSKWDNKTVAKAQSSEAEVNIKQIFEFPLTFWLVVVMLALCNNAVFGFISISQQFLQDKYDLSREEADHISSLFNLISAVISPVTGYLVDRFGRDLYFNFCGLAIGTVSLIIMSVTSRGLWVPIIMYSMFFSILDSCGWPLVARIAQPYQIATAYGIAQSSINLVSTAFNLFIGLALKEHGPIGVSLLLLGAVAVGAVCCLTVWILDSRAKGTMNSSASRRKALT